MPEIKTYSSHDLKIAPHWFEEISFNGKEFEIRKNDRGFKVGDVLVLHEWDGEKYTHNYIIAKISYIFEGNGDYGLEKGYCVLGLADIEILT